MVRGKHLGHPWSVRVASMHAYQQQHMFEATDKRTNRRTSPLH